MSRIGKQTIMIPAGVEVKFHEGQFSVRGPLGTLQRRLRPEIMVELDGETIKLQPRKNSLFSRALWGTYARHLRNLIEGVTRGYRKKLLIEGIGYKANVNGDKVILDLGASHSIEVSIPAGLTVTAGKGELLISGSDKELVGDFAAKIRALKPTEPYKGKGIRYENEVVRRKQGKKSTA